MCPRPRLSEGTQKQETKDPLYNNALQGGCKFLSGKNLRGEEKEGGSMAVRSLGGLYPSINL